MGCWKWGAACGKEYKRLWGWRPELLLLRLTSCYGALSSDIHLRSAISNVTELPPAMRGYRTKVCPLFMSPTLPKRPLMNITDWFSEKLKMPPSPVVGFFSEEDNDPQKKVFSFKILSLSGVSLFSTSTLKETGCGGRILHLWMRVRWDTHTYIQYIYVC